MSVKPNWRGDGHDRLNGDLHTVHMMSPAVRVPGAAQILLGHSQTAATRALLASCRGRASARARSCAGVGLTGVRAAPQVSETAVWADSAG
jgi:hypothetical protein